jgi:hypothetical protein
MTVKIRMNPNFKAEVLKAAEEKLSVKIREDVLCKCGHKESAHTLNPQESGRACGANLYGPRVISNKVVVCACQRFEPPK